MSKKCQNGTILLTNNENVITNGSSFKINEKLLTSIDIGLTNLARWNALKNLFLCKNDEEFAKILLDLGQAEIKRKSTENENELTVSSNLKSESQIKNESDNVNVQQEEPLSLPSSEEDINENDTAKNQIEEQTNFKNITNTPEVLKVNVTEQVKKNVANENKNIKPQKSKSNKNKKKLTKLNKVVDKQEKTKNKVEHDIRKAPELTVQSDDIQPSTDLQEDSISNVDKHRVAIKIKMCFNCDTRHVQELCPLQNSMYIVLDSITKDRWNEEFKLMYLNDKELDSYSYAYLSLPNILTLEQTNTTHGLSIFTKCDIKEYTQFGPLVGNIIKEVDIAEDNSMRDVWEIYGKSGNVYINTENIETSNWIKFIRPANLRDNRNIAAIIKEDKLYFVTTKLISKGEELLYWQDDTFKTHKKKMQKTICGGCNITFTHPLYYRTHCSVFHDVRYSLTIRKYHCKICGAAVLGKENIMKHAAELHNGQGAYQCQFCKKFFLRLNYLEIHRTYGCSSNPHRSRPLCDFCGRKFCQPQKLKVHIKRMHSDMSEVLKEFQCKNCLKILGSRAALQRHLKEVHQKQVDGAYSCNRCNKLFQNKSNLKIHMLTHSGIKPFKCTEESCLSAFTTKQCLQFHYKKVHGFTEDMMPKIQRSVEYTFEAYSGADDDKIDHSNNDKYLDAASDLDDSSLDGKNLNDPPPLLSPAPITSDNSSNTSPPMLEAYNSNPTTVKVVSKGSKKWIGDSQPPVLAPQRTDLYSLENRNQKLQDIDLDNEEPVQYEQTAFTRREPTNASLLVEAALDSVCSEPNIDVDVGSTTNCNDTLNNLYNLSHTDNLPDVTYNHSIDMNETRDINLISPSVNDHISVTDDLSDDLRHSQNIGIDYSTFQQEDFTPESSPNIERNNFRDYINVNPVSPRDCQSKNVSPIPSPPRYDFGHTVAENLSSDDSNGIGAQNLSLNNSNKDSIQLDLSIYKTPYNFESNLQLRSKDFRIKFDMEADRNKDYILNVDDEEKFINTDNQIDSNDINEMNGDIKDKESEMDDVRNLSELRNKFDIENEIRCRAYDSLDEFRLKNYEVDSLDSRTIDVRNKIYDGLLDSEFRADRNFEPLVINSELQGLDMSARSYHNYSNLNRYHHLYPDSVDLRLNYSPPPPSYSHADILRVVSIDSVDLSLRSQINPHRLSLDQSRLLTTDLTTSRHLNTESRLISELGNRLLSDHTTNRLLSNDQLTTNRLLTTDQRILSDDSRLLTEQPRLLEQSRMLGDTRILPPSSATAGTLSPAQYTGYSVSPTPYALPPRPHNTSPAPYHHYSAYY